MNIWVFISISVAIKKKILHKYPRSRSLHLYKPNNVSAIKIFFQSLNELIP